MLKMLGDNHSNTVDTIVMGSGTSSLVRHSQNNLLALGWLQVSVYTLFVRRLWTVASTAVISLFTSVRSGLYPVSTVPIVITTKFNKLIIVRS
jgi:hypothetical protein